MMYSVDEQLLTINRPKTSLKPQGFVIHSTDTPRATAQNEYNYFNSGYRGASAHYFIDSTSIVRTVPENEVAWHAGQTANSKYLSAEMCETEPFEEVWKRTVWLVADACVRYGWSTGPNVWSHRGISNLYHETNHTDPIDFLKRNGKTWDDLLTAIDQEIENIKNGGNKVAETKVESDPDIYLTVRVRTSKADQAIKDINKLGFACKKLELA
jgi:N-acetylmuramoyl-L-alanine amidase